MRGLFLVLFLAIIGAVIGYLIFGRIAGQYVGVARILLPDENPLEALATAVTGIKQMRQNILISAAVGGVVGLVLAISTRRG